MKRSTPGCFFLRRAERRFFRGCRGIFEAGKLLVKLIGTEGSGKTLMCKVLFEQLPDKIEVVYLDDPKGSFDDLLRVVCIDLGLQAVGEQVDLVEELKKQLQQRKERGRKVVLVLDGAEKIFLATLERFLRLLCELEEFSGFTLMLAGRPSLDTNLEQLTVYCTGVDIHAGYYLEPMTLEETGQYLIFRLLAAGLGNDKQQDVFTGEAVEKIYAKAGGNPRLTNILAEEALQRSCSEKSFMVLLDHVDAEADPVKHERKKRALLQDIQEKKRHIGIGVGLAVLLLIVFFLLVGKEEPENTAVFQGSPPVAAGDVRAVKKESQKPEPETVHLAAEKVAETSQSQRASAVFSEAADKQTPTAVEQPAAENQKQKQAEESVSRDGETLFEERLRASASWLAGAYRGQYTIQLMMLSSDQAPANVKKLLVEDEYFTIKDNLYILRKKTTPLTLFVFYGTFDAMDDARQARNQMPIFLRKHHPYALSIADALTKTED